MGLLVGIGISTYNGSNRVDELLASLEKHTDPVEGGFDVHVIDDGGKESELVKLLEVCANYGVSVERHEKNLGIPPTWNHLTRHFDSEFMVLLNDDIILVDDWLINLLYFAQNNKFATAGLPSYIPKKTGKPYSGWKKSGHGWRPFLAEPTDTPMRVPSAPGPCFIFKRSLFDFIGGFDERYWSFYEEVDFSFRLVKLGYASYILPEPWIHHYWARSFAENPELTPNQRMDDSRAQFQAKWNMPLEGAYLKFGRTVERQNLKWLLNGEEKTGLEPVGPESCLHYNIKEVKPN